MCLFFKRKINLLGVIVFIFVLRCGGRGGGRATRASKGSQHVEAVKPRPAVVQLHFTLVYV